MNKPPSGSITFGTFGVTAASEAAGFCSERRDGVSNVCPEGAGVTQRAERRETHRNIMKDGRNSSSDHLGSFRSDGWSLIQQVAL